MQNILVGHHGWSAPRQTSPANKKEFYPWHIWTATSADTSGNTSGYWMCATRHRALNTGETSSNATHAGSIITDDHIYHDVSGTTWANTSSNISVYLNITKNDLNSVTGQIATSACPISLSGNPITYPVTLANLYVSSGRITVEQEYDVDYTDASISVYNDSFHPYRTFIKTEATTGVPNVYYSVTQNNPNVDTSVAGFVFSEDISKYTVSGIPWTQITSDTSCYLNVTSIDMTNAQGQISTTPIAVQLDPTSGNRTYPVLISEIVYNSGNPSLIVRKFEDHYLSSVSGASLDSYINNHKYHPFLVTVDQDTSANWRWNCNQQNDPTNLAGRVYSKFYDSYTIDGTGYNNLATGNTDIYCNITEFVDGSISGFISTSPIAKILSTSAESTYPYHVANINYSTGSTPIKIQHYSDDIYIYSHASTSGGGTSNPESFGFKIWTRNATASNYEYGVSIIDPDDARESLAGMGYRTDGATFNVSKKAYTSTSATYTSLYCNVTVTSRSSWSGVIATSAIANSPFTSAATFAIFLGTVDNTLGDAKIRQSHVGCIDYRGKMIPTAIDGYSTYSFNQVFGRSGNDLLMYTIADCPSG